MGAAVISALQHRFANIRNELLGGLVSAAVAIPLAMGFGMFAFVSLGDQYFANGALAGLYTAFIVAIASIVLGDKTPNVYAPRVTTTFFIGILLYNLVNSGAAIFADLSVTLATIFSIVLLGGAFQLLFGLVKLGTLIKFAPYPVMAGFQNAAALLLFLVQLASVFGFDKSVRFTVALGHLDQAKPLSLLVAIVTFAAMWNSRKILPKIPPVVLGLAVGTAGYYALVLAGFAQSLGPIIGSTPFAAFGPSRLPDFAGLVRNAHVAEILPTIVGGAVALALIASIDALLCAKLLTRPGDARVDGNKLLARLGIGNMVAACLGGITGGLNLGPSLTNRALGARTQLSVVVNALVILLALSVMFPLVVYLPRVALSAVIMVVAVQHLDPWSLRLVRQFASGSAAYRRNVAPELFVVLSVAILSIALDIVLAVFLGVAFAVALFLARMSRSVIRRRYRCDGIRSRKSRTLEEMRVLERRGSSILVMELQGALFFGTAENLANEIATQLLQETRSVILDLRRVTEIDSTGSQILSEIHAELAAKEKRLLISRVRESESSARLIDFAAGATASDVFQDIDRAIESAEDDLLREELPGRISDREIPLDRIGILSGFGAADIAAIRPHLVRMAYQGGNVVFHEGDPGKEVFMIVKGTASAYLRQADGGDIRLVTFAPGAAFGELAILDRGKRSASVIADEDLVCYVLSEEAFAALSAEAPGAAIKLLANLGRELSGRLRRANWTIHQLEM